MTYDENGRFKVGGAYDHTGRKVGYDAADMKNGISDVNKGYGDNPRYLARENDYLKNHPINTGSNIGLHHQGTLGDSDLTNNHGGQRNVNMVRTDIRHGLNILKEKHPNGVEGGHAMITAERLGYNARKHHYVKAEKEAFMKTPAGQRQAEQSARASNLSSKQFDPWGTEPSAKPAPSAPAKPAAKKGGGFFGKLRKR